MISPNSLQISKNWWIQFPYHLRLITKIRFFELSKFLEFPVFKEEGLNREVLRSWIGRKILTELSKTITVPNDNNGIEIYNTIELSLIHI